MGLVTIRFDEDVTGLTIADLSLTRDGNPVDLSAQNIAAVSAQEYTIDLSGITAAAGSYELALTSTGSSVVDAVGNALVADASANFVVDLIPPVGTIQPVTPDPRSTPVGMVTVDFDEGVSGVDITDFSLLVDGNQVDLAGIGGLVQVNSQQYTLDLTTVTAQSGDYSLTVTAAGSGIVDALGNAIATDITESFVVDAVAPTADIIDIAPDPRLVAVTDVTVSFDETVFGVDVEDFTLTRDGTTIDISLAPFVATSSDLWTLTLTDFTSGEGTYVLTLNASTSGIQDGVGNFLVANAVDTFQVVPGPSADIVDVVPDPRKLCSWSGADRF